MRPILKYRDKGIWSLKFIFFFLFLILIPLFWVTLHSLDKNKTFPLKTVKELLPPDCSAKSGFYSDPFSINLNSQNKEVPVYYTLDGSEPTMESMLYSSNVFIEGEIPDISLATIPTSPRWVPPLGKIFKGVVLRAVTIENAMKSKELVRTFFIRKEAAPTYTLPIIALTVNPDDLFGFKNGIYVMGKNYEEKRKYIKKKLPLDLPWWNYPANYQKRGENAERPVHIEFFEATGQLAFKKNAGLRINGNATRGFSQKSMRVCFDQKYDEENLDYRLFPSAAHTIFKNFILSNGGNDWTKTLFRNSCIQSIMTGLDLDVQASRSCIVFINGEYWGIHQLCERFDNYYISNHYDINPDSISVLEVVNGNLHGNQKDLDQYEHILKFASDNDLTIDSNYSYLEKVIDIDSFMDIIIANSFVCNADWPNNNIKFWRYKKEKKDTGNTGVRDGRWRWMLYDTDWGLGYTGEEAVYLNLLEKAEKSRTLGIIFGKILRNKTFLDKFSSRFHYYLSNRFSTDSLIAHITEFEQKLAPEMKEHINRWRVIGTFTNWQNNVVELKEFAKKRPAIQQQQLNTFINKYK